MARVWEAWLIDNKPNYKKIWAALGALVDVAIVSGIFLTMFFHSCEICYATGINYKVCQPINDAFENGSNLAPIYKAAWSGSDYDALDLIRGLNDSKS